MGSLCITGDSCKIKGLMVQKKDATPALRELMSRERDLTPHAQVTAGHHGGVTGATPAQQTRRASDAATVELSPQGWQVRVRGGPSQAGRTA